MKQYKLLILTIIVLTLNVANAQVANNYFILQNLPHDEDMISSIELSNGNIVATLKNSIPMLADSSLCAAELMLIDKYGTIISTVKYTDKSKYTYIPFLERIDTSKFIAIGYSFDKNADPGLITNACLSIYTFDNNLNVLCEKHIFSDTLLPFYPLVGISKLFNGNFLASWQIDVMGFDMKLFEFSSECDSIATYIVDKPDTFHNRCFGFEQKPDTSGYLVLDKGHWLVTPRTSTYENILHLNNNFEVIESDSLPGQCSWLGRIKRFSDNRYLVAGTSMYYWLTNDPTNPKPQVIHPYLIEFLDYNLNAVKKVIPTPVQPKSVLDTILYPAGAKAFDFIDTNNIYASYSFFVFQTPIQSSPFYVLKLNANLDIKWNYAIDSEKGGYFFSQNVMATQDGGVFISGLWSPNQMFTEQDYFYFRTDSTGLFLGSSDPGIKLHSATLYPNPGTNQFTLLTGPQIDGAVLQVFDMSGRQIFADKISNTTTEIDTRNWIPGTYPWRIIHKSKIVDEGKWVKAKD